MKMCLIGKDLWELVDGEKILNAEATLEEQRKFGKRENMAVATACLSVETSLQIYVRSAQTAKGTWDNLEQRSENGRPPQVIIKHSPNIWKQQTTE